jgi:hypothetical protein
MNSSAAIDESSMIGHGSPSGTMRSSRLPSLPVSTTTHTFGTAATGVGIPTLVHSHLYPTPMQQYHQHQQQQQPGVPSPLASSMALPGTVGDVQSHFN